MAFNRPNRRRATLSESDVHLSSLAVRRVLRGRGPPSVDCLIKRQDYVDLIVNTCRPLQGDKMMSPPRRLS
jgi:hypothetical protein